MSSSLTSNPVQGTIFGIRANMKVIIVGVYTDTGTRGKTRENNGKFNYDGSRIKAMQVNSNSDDRLWRDQTE